MKELTILIIGLFICNTLFAQDAEFPEGWKGWNAMPHNIENDDIDTTSNINFTNDSIPLDTVSILFNDIDPGRIYYDERNDTIYIKKAKIYIEKGYIIIE